MGNPKPNQLYVVVSLALVLFLLGLVGLWTFQANYLTRQLQENLDIIVELEAEHSVAQRDSLVAHLLAADYHKTGTVPTFISRDEAL
ncbi:MAG: hypothetical protein AAFN92_17680, partial [Bacteroidota bacterium]